MVINVTDSNRCGEEFFRVSELVSLTLITVMGVVIYLLKILNVTYSTMV